MVQVTLTGQLALLMLIEALYEVMGADVVSANTDGVTVRVRKDAIDDVLAATKEWERVTGFELERADYTGLYSRDVNNYIAVKTNGEVKTKGVYGSGLPLHKNPVAKVCADAVIAYVTHRTPIRQTIEACEDMRKFICIRSVTGGALYKGEYVGKVIRWYYAKGETESFHYKTNNYVVATTTGGRPCMELPMLPPDDLDREWYVTSAQSMLADFGEGI